MGLGNPGPEYENTRHNAGFLLADRLAARWRFPAFRRVPAARETQGNVEGTDVRLIKPQTYMNRSGAALASLRSLSGFDPAKELLVVVDDVALPIGRFRLRPGGSAGGHNGLKSIEGALRSPEYPRLRIGVGPVPPEQEGLADYVLDQFTKNTKTRRNTDTTAEGIDWKKPCFVFFVSSCLTPVVMGRSKNAKDTRPKEEWRP